MQPITLILWSKMCNYLQTLKFESSTAQQFTANNNLLSQLYTKSSCALLARDEDNYCETK